MSTAVKFKYTHRKNCLRSELKSAGNYAMIPAEIFVKKWPGSRLSVLGTILCTPDDFVICATTLIQKTRLARSTVMAELSWLVQHGYLEPRQLTLRTRNGMRKITTWDVLSKSAWKDEIQSESPVQDSGHEPENGYEEESRADEVSTDACHFPPSEGSDTIQDKEKSKSKYKNRGDLRHPAAEHGMVLDIGQITLNKLDHAIRRALHDEPLAMGKDARIDLRKMLLEHFSRETLLKAMEWRAGEPDFLRECLREIGGRPAQAAAYRKKLRSLEYWQWIIGLSGADSVPPAPPADKTDNSPPADWQPSECEYEPLDLSWLPESGVRCE